MCLAVLIVHDKVHPNFKPRRWAQASLIVSAMLAPVALVILIRAALEWSTLTKTDSWLLAGMMLSWTTLTVSYIVTAYAR